MAKALSFAFPHEAIRSGAKIHLRSRPRGLDHGRVGAACADEDAHDPSAERRAKHLTEHSAALPLLVLQSENTAIGKNAEVESGCVRGAPEAEAAFARRRKAPFRRHRSLPLRVRPGGRPMPL